MRRDVTHCCAEGGSTSFLAQIGSRRLLLLVLFLFVGLYLIPLGLRPFVVPDEFRYSDIPRSMLATGDWVTPRLDGLLYFEKPALGYWLEAASMAALGTGRFAARLPSALAAAVSAGLLVWLLARTGAGLRTGVLAAVILLTSLQIYCTGTFVVLDGPFSMMVTATLVLWFVAYQAERASTRRLLLVLSGGFCGLALLTKGLVVLAVVGLTVGPFLLIERRLAIGLRTAWIPAVVAAAVTLPWAALIQLRQPEFWSYFILTEHFGRFLKPGGAQHPASAFYFIPVLLVGALPWSAVAPAAVRALWRDRGASSSLIRFALCWLGPSFLFFSASSGKLSTYILPLYPPLAIVLALGLVRALEGPYRRMWRAGASVSALAAGAGMVGLILQRHHLWDPSETWRAWILALALLCWVMLALYSTLAHHAGRALAAFCASPVLFLLALSLALPVAVKGAETPGALLARHAAKAGPETRVAADIAMVHAACWAFGRDDVLLIGGTGELSFGLEREGQERRRVTVPELVAGLEADAAPNVVLVGERASWERWRLLVPEASEVEIEGNVVVAELRRSR